MDQSFNSLHRKKNRVQGFELVFLSKFQDWIDNRLSNQQLSKPRISVDSKPMIISKGGRGGGCVWGSHPIIS